MTQQTTGGHRGTIAKAREGAQQAAPHTAPALRGVCPRCGYGTQCERGWDAPRRSWRPLRDHRHPVRDARGHGRRAEPQRSEADPAGGHTTVNRHPCEHQAVGPAARLAGMPGENRRISPIQYTLYTLYRGWCSPMLFIGPYTTLQKRQFTQ
jgi:hypothetical protein